MICFFVKERKKWFVFLWYEGKIESKRERKRVVLIMCVIEFRVFEVCINREVIDL